jgi:hypothetical protein
MKIELFIIILLSSCNTSREGIQDSEISIRIKQSMSYEIDLKHKTYTVFFQTRPPLSLNFDLTQDEENGIKEKYFSLELDKISKNVRIEGHCNFYPQLFTSLSIESQSFSQEITISNNCNKFSFSDSSNARRINEFIRYIFNTLHKKTEIKNSPESDVSYF